METRNITLSLPKTLIRQAKVYAAQNDTTMNGLIKELLEHKLSEAETDRPAAVVRAILESAAEGVQVAIDPRSIRREEIYERR